MTLKSDPVALIPAAQDDVQYMTEIMAKIWPTDTTFPFLYPQCWTDSKPVTNFIFKSLGKAIQQPKSESLVAITEGEVVGFGKWTLNDGEEAADVGGPKPLPPPGSEKFRETIFLAAAKQFQALMKDINHYELDTMAVKIGYQHRGIGTMFVKDLCAKADEKNLPILVMSLPTAKGFYKHFGFEERDTFEFDLADWGGPEKGYGKYRYYGLVRLAQKSK